MKGDESEDAFRWDEVAPKEDKKGTYSTPKLHRRLAFRSQNKSASQRVSEPEETGKRTRKGKESPKQDSHPWHPPLRITLIRQIKIRT